MSENNNNIGEYSYTKAVRFDLKESKGSLEKVQSEGTTDIKKLCIDGVKHLSGLKNFLYSKSKEKDEFKKDENGNLIFDKNISVKKEWLKLYFKNDFYKKSKQKDFSISQIDYVSEGFKKWFDEFETNLKETEELYKNNSRRSEIGFYISKLSSNQSLGFLRSFIENVNHKDNQTKADKLRDEIEKFENLVTGAREEYLPSQSMGLCIAKGSMNYYTVNKKSKKYYEDELKNLEEEKKKVSAEYDKNKGVFYVYVFNKKIRKIEKKDFKLREEEKYWFEDYPEIKNSDGEKVEFNLEETYALMKEFKANMKSRFYEMVNKGETSEEIRKKFHLFDNECLEEVIRLSNKIKNYLNKQNISEIRKKISKIKIERGHYFIRRRKQDLHFKNYFNFCENFKEIARKRGRLKAQIKGVERERIESQNNKYWVLLLKEKQGKFLLLVPKEKMKEVKECLNKLPHEAESDNVVYVMESLTKRALHKLCFAEESTFAEEMLTEEKELYDELQNVKKATNDEKQLSKNRWKNLGEKLKDDLMLPFLKNVLKSDYAKNKLDLTHFDLTKVFETENLNDFESELESACYKLREIPISKEKTDELTDVHSVIKCEIDSYDLEERNKNTYQTPESEYKRHTREIWNKFWKEKDDVRLNPEIKIHFKKKDTELEKYLRNRDFDLSRIKHRNLKDKHTLTMSFSLNAGKKYPDLAFAKTEDLLKEINKFNSEFNKRNWKNFYKYGVDRGNIQFATLCIAKFNENELYEVKVNGETKKIPKPTFPEGEEDIKCYELKEKYYDKKLKSDLENLPHDKRKEKRVIANVSYFIDKVENKEWFEEKNCTCIDLTTAKVIKNKIILNGDVLTFLKLKKEAAKKLIFENYNQNSELNTFENGTKKKRMKIQMDDKEIYYFDKKFEGLLIKDNLKYTPENILEDLQKYLDQLKTTGNSEHKPSVEKINHLRDSIVANMVGVIALLQKEYPGFVILEDLDETTVNEHFQDLYINVSRRLEFGLFNKFQTLGLVPPHIKNLIKIREDRRNKREKEKEEEVKEEMEIKNMDENELSKSKRDRLENKTKSRMKDYSEQFGSIIFVNERGTSSGCPYCEKEINYDKDRKDFLKFEEKRFVCGEHKDNECEFDTSDIKEKYDFLKEIDDPDKVAAYNVAKKIKKPEDDVQKLSEENKKNS